MKADIEGHVWGGDVKPLLQLLDEEGVASTAERYDLLLLSDLVFNHSQVRSFRLYGVPLTSSTPP